MDIIVTAAERIFDISRFFDDDDDPESPENEYFDDGSYSHSESSSEDSSDEDSDLEYGKRLKKRRFLKKSEAKAKKSKSSEKSTPKSRSKGTSTPAAPIPKTSDTDEVADLNDKLGHLNLDGPGYASLYFQIVSQAPNTASFLAEPRTHR